MCRLAAHHFRDIKKAVDSMVRITKKGGRIAIIDLMGKSNPVADEINHQIEVLHDPTHIRSYTTNEWLEFFNRKDTKLLLIEDKQLESPKGITIDRWCQIAASGEKAKNEILEILKNTPRDILQELGVSINNEIYHYHVQTLLIVVEKVS